MVENDIAESLRRMALQSQACIEAASAFDKLGSIKASTDEATKVRDAALTEVATAKNDAAAAKAKTLELQKQADDILLNAQGQAANIVSVAQLSAQMMGKDADQLIINAKEQAELDAAVLIDKTKTTLASTFQKIEDNQAKIMDLEKQIDDLKADLADAQAMYDKTRDAMKALAGAAA